MTRVKVPLLHSITTGVSSVQSSSSTLSPVKSAGAARARRPALLWAGAYLLAVTIALYSLFAGWGYDDPFITYRYAANLAGRGELVYNPGQFILSTTTPLFTLLLAGLSFLWNDLPHLANLLGVASLAWGGLCLLDLGKTYGTRWVGWAGLLLYPTFPLLISTLGSETPLYLACILSALALYARRRWTLAAIAAGLAVLARPDGALVPVLLAAHYLLHRTSSARHPLPWSALAAFLAVTLPWFLFAGWYYGFPLPVTLAVKQHQGSMTISETFLPGFFSLVSDYADVWLYNLEAMLAALGLVGLSIPSLKRWNLLLLWVLMYFSAYSLLGVSRYFWYYAPLAPGFLVLIGLGLEWMVRKISASSASSPGRLGRSLITILLAGLFLWQGAELGRLQASNDPRLVVYEQVGRWLQANTAPGATVGILEVGIVGYYSQRIMVDFAGLIQPQVMEHLRPETTYEEAAVWTVDHFRPDYLVLHDGLFPNVEAGYAAQNCHSAWHLSGAPYGYGEELTVYACTP